MAAEHDFSGLPLGRVATHEGFRSGLVASLVIALLGVVLSVIGPAFSAAGASRAFDVAAEQQLDVGAGSTQRGSDAGAAYFEQLGQGTSIAGAAMLSGGVLLLGWLLSRPRSTASSGS